MEIKKVFTFATEINDKFPDAQTLQIYYLSDKVLMEGDKAIELLPSALSSASFWPVINQLQ
jgi:hypothetical protein